MLEAYISGQARLAAVIQGASMECLEAGSNEPESRNLIEFEYLFADVGDLRIERCPDWSDVSRKLQTSVHQDDALALLLILLDGHAAQDARLESVSLVEEALHDPAVLGFLFRRLSAAPLPANADLGGSLTLAHSENAKRIVELLLKIGDLQSEIKRVCSIWEELPDKHFILLPPKISLYRSLRDLGVFQYLAMDDLKLALEALNDWPVDQHPRLAALIREWYFEAWDEAVRKVEMILSALNATEKLAIKGEPIAEQQGQLPRNRYRADIQEKDDQAFTS